MVIERLIELKFHRGKHWILVQWKGFDEETNRFEPLKIIFQDLPELTWIFVQNHKNTRESKEFIALLEH